MRPGHQEKRGKFSAGNTWCNTLLDECHLTKRNCTTQASKLPENYLSLGHRLMLQVSTQVVCWRCNLCTAPWGRARHVHLASARLEHASVVSPHCTAIAALKQSCLFVQMAFFIATYKIPAALTINSDQTGVPLTFCTDYTRAPKGSKEVTASGYGDKADHSHTHHFSGRCYAASAGMLKALTHMCLALLDRTCLKGRHNS